MENFDRRLYIFMECGIHLDRMKDDQEEGNNKVGLELHKNACFF